MKKWFTKVLFSKKLVMGLCGLAFSFLAAKGLDVPDEFKVAIIGFVLLLVERYIKHQSVLDAATNGRTSAAYVGGAADKALEDVVAMVARKVAAEQAAELGLPLDETTTGTGE